LLGVWAATPLAYAELPPACRRTPSAAASAAPAAAALVIVLDLGDELGCALSTALEPWGSRVVRGSAPQPGSSMPSSSLIARALAQQEGARAVVWLARDAQGFALWVYDARADRSWARAAPAPPFEASVAAALALSVKTVLRIAGLDPEHAAEAPADGARAPTSASPTPPTPTTGETRAAAPAAGAARAWQIGVSAGVRLGPLERRPEARYALDLRWSPGARASASAAGPARAPQAWVALAFESGVPQRVHGARFEGEWLDWASELGFGVTQGLGQGWTIGAGAAAALHVTRLSGVARELNLPVDDTHLNPVLSLRGELLLELGLPSLALQPGAELWVRRQQFLIEEQPVANTARVAARLMLLLRLPLD